MRFLTLVIFFVAVCGNCDQHEICGPESFCKIWEEHPTCHGTSVACGCQDTESPLAKELISPKQLDESCASSSVPIFIWAEWPTLASAADAQTYYQRMLQFVTSNCGNFNVNRLVLRILTPTFSLNGGSTVWGDPQNSPLYSELLAHLPNSMEIVLMPYLGDDNSKNAWKSLSPSGNPWEGVAVFLQKWNSFLSGSGSAIQFRGVAIDSEEMKADESTVADLKSRFGNFEFGVTTGFDELGAIATFANFVDKIYIELYDFYGPSVNIDRSADSPFSVNKNNADALVQNILNSQLSDKIRKVYEDNSEKIMAMWSTQSTSTAQCINPQDDGNCGINEELGSWDAQSANQFISAISQSIAVNSHGLFQFNFIPLSWT